MKKFPLQKIALLAALLLSLPLSGISQGVLLTGPFNVSVCAPLSASFHVQADSGSGNYTYTWYLNSTQQNVTTSTYTFNQTDTSMSGSTIYCVVGDMGVSYYSDTAILIVLDCSVQPLLVDAGMYSGICDLSCLQFNPFVSGGVPPYLYHWSPAGGFNNPVFDPSLPSPMVCFNDSLLHQTLYLNYTLTVTDSIGNSASDSVMITVYPLPMVDAGNDTLIIQGNSVQLNAVVTNASPPWSFQWSPPAGLSVAWIANPTASPTVTTTYTLTVATNTGCTATDAITINVNAPAFYNLGGQVFAGLYPLDLGIADLTIINGNYMNQAGWMTFDTLGYYYFPQQLGGNYFVKAEPAAGSAAFGNYAPTYFGDALNWTNAVMINLNTDLFNEDIHLLSIPGPSPGQGNISGSVFSGAKGDPIEMAEILLKDGSGNLLTYSNSDALGRFEFSGIAYGTYVLYPEIAGKTAAPVTVVLGPNTPDVTNIIFTVNENNIAAGINESSPYPGFSVGNIYPDPAGDLAYIHLSTKTPCSVVFRIISLTGQLIRSFTENTSGDHQIIMKLSNLQSGIYFVEISTDSMNFTRKLIKR